eukprot:scaffold2636_cov340-Pavlova_lutheri.AAC.116
MDPNVAWCSSLAWTTVCQEMCLSVNAILRCLSKDGWERCRRNGRSRAGERGPMHVGPGVVVQLRSPLPPVGRPCITVNVRH